MDSQSKDAFVHDARGISKWFKITLKIEIFGHVIYEVVWPPQKS